MIGRCSLLTGIAALFLATGTARADEFVILIQKGDEKPSTAFATIGMSCAEVLESHERNRKAGTKRITRQASWTKPRKLWAWYSQRTRMRRCH
jgi:hypothetical protein